ncbi:MAG: SAM-dependent methyltransferase, partial [Halobacteria archaeon]|nr:SAM-dependent methyltransferase [Halobacteria archaeon]
NPFYRDATFVSTDELVDALEDAGFDDFEFAQTLFDVSLDEVETPKRGYGEGSFVVVKAS